MEILSPTEPDVDRGPTLIAIFSTECAVSLAFLSLRLWARTRTSAIGFDDVFMTITWLLFASITIIVGIFGASGGTRHTYYLSNEQAIYVTKLDWVSQALAITALATGKVAVGLLLLRLIASTSRWRRITIYVLMALTVIFSILAVVFTFAQCQNPAALWDPSVHAMTSCWDPKVQSNFSTFTGGLNSAVDIAFSLIPITLIWRLHLSTKKRVGLVILLSGGVFSGISAAIKTNQLVTLTARSDLTWETFGLYLWTGIEIFLILVCGCIPTLRPLWDHVFGKRLRSNQGGSCGWASQNSAGKRHGSQRQFAQEPDQELGIFDHNFQQVPSSRGLSNQISASRDDSRGSRPTLMQDEEQLIQVTRSYNVDYH
ncbi:hypothetical protein F5X98DRAFT_368384 [Xylaria grammica]|nr:hypothetical protein F5X98DRAFT_368384 [Xylaria grammica]